MAKSKLQKGLAALLEDETPKKAPKKAAKKRADDILEVNAAEEETISIVHLDLKAIHPDPDNPRKSFPEGEMDELIESVREKGVLQPIIVRPVDKGYEIVAGERRWRAGVAVATAYKSRNTIPAIIRTLSNKEVKEIQIIENIQRADMHPMEEAEAFQELSLRNLSPEEIGAKVGKSVYYVRRRLKLISLESEWINPYKLGHISHADAIKIAALASDSQRDLFERKYREAVLVIDDWWLRDLQHKLSSAKFEQEWDYEGLPKCGNCPFNSAYNSLFPGEEKEAYCKNSKCFDLKEAYQFDELLESAKDDPTVVLIANQYSTEKTEIKQWKDKGLQVYNADDFNPIYEPDKKEYDLDPEEYDGGENDEDYKEELERYQEDLKEYQADMKRPDLVKGMAMSGNGKGEVQIGYMDKNPRLIGQESGIKSDGSSDGPKSIADEIERIESNEKRAKELDGEKVWAKIVGLLEDPDNRSKVFNADKLTSQELYAAAYAICRKMNYNHNSWICEFFGDTTERHTYEVPEEISSKMLLGVIRMFICDILVTNYGSHLKENSAAAIAFPILEKYLPKDVALFQIEQQEIAEKRQERVNKRIADLKKKEA